MINFLERSHKNKFYYIQFFIKCGQLCFSFYIYTYVSGYKEIFTGYIIEKKYLLANKEWVNFPTIICNNFF